VYIARNARARPRRSGRVIGVRAPVLVAGVPGEHERSRGLGARRLLVDAVAVRAVRRDDFDPVRRPRLVRVLLDPVDDGESLAPLDPGDADGDRRVLGLDATPAARVAVLTAHFDAIAHDPPPF